MMGLRDFPWDREDVGVFYGLLPQNTPTYTPHPGNPQRDAMTGRAFDHTEASTSVEVFQGSLDSGIGLQSDFIPVADNR
jgi:hypothetical protein